MLRRRCLSRLHFGYGLSRRLCRRTRWHRRRRCLSRLHPGRRLSLRNLRRRGPSLGWTRSLRRWRLRRVRRYRRRGRLGRLRLSRRLFLRILRLAGWCGLSQQVALRGLRAGARAERRGHRARQDCAGKEKGWRKPHANCSANGRAKWRGGFVIQDRCNGFTTPVVLTAAVARSSPRSSCRFTNLPRASFRAYGQVRAGLWLRSGRNVRRRRSARASSPDEMQSCPPVRRIARSAR